MKLSQILDSQKVVAQLIKIPSIDSTTKLEIFQYAREADKIIEDYNKVNQQIIQPKIDKFNDLYKDKLEKMPENEKKEIIKQINQEINKEVEKIRAKQYKIKPFKISEKSLSSLKEISVEQMIILANNGFTKK